MEKILDLRLVVSLLVFCFVANMLFGKGWMSSKNGGVTPAPTTNGNGNGA